LQVFRIDAGIDQRMAHAASRAMDGDSYHVDFPVAA
jgi:hypothetical protein